MAAKRSRLGLLLLTLLTASGLLIRLWGIDFGLPNRFYHVDEFNTYIIQAFHLGSERFLRPLEYHNPALFHYLLLGEYALFFGVGRVGGLFESLGQFREFFYDQPSAFFLLGRASSALLGTATIPLVYFLGRRAYGGRVGLAGAALLSFAFMHVRESHYATNDVAVTFMVTLALYYCLRLYQEGGRRSYLLAGLFVGLATATKYQAVLVGLTLILAHLLRARRTGGPLLRERRLWQGVGLSVAIFFATNPFLIFDFDNSLRTTVMLIRWGFEGFLEYNWYDGPGWTYYLDTLDWGLGTILMIAVPLGVVVALWRRRDEDLILLSYPLLLYLFLGAMAMNVGRFMLPALPALLLLVAAAADGLLRRWLPPRVASGALAALVLVSLFQPALYSIRHDDLLTEEDTRTQAKAWIETNIPRGTPIAMDIFGPELYRLGGEPFVQSDYRLMGVDARGITRSGERTIEDYRKAGARYVVTSSYISNMGLVDPRLEARHKEFYASLERNETMIAEFKPYTGDREPKFRIAQHYGPATDLFYIERPGPTIKIYELRPPESKPAPTLDGGAATE